MHKKRIRLSAANVGTLYSTLASAPRTAGIYAITNRENGHQYIGSAKNIALRWSVHLRGLVTCTHVNVPLSRAWQKYGPDAFTLSVLENVAALSSLIEREQHYMDTLRPYYNMAPTAGSMLGYTFTAESRAKIAAALTGRPVGPFTDEHRQRISAGRKGKGVGVPSPKKGWKNTRLTQDEFIALWSTTTSRELAEMCGWSQANVSLWARKLGLPPRYGAGGTGLLKPRTPLAAGQWGVGREWCAECGTTDLPHKAFGWCTYCYRRLRTLREDPDAEERGSYTRDGR